MTHPATVSPFYSASEDLCNTPSAVKWGLFLSGSFSPYGIISFPGLKTGRTTTARGIIDTAQNFSLSVVSSKKREEILNFKLTVVSAKNTRRYLECARIEDPEVGARWSGDV